MKLELKQLLPFADTAHSWLVNLSVVSVGVGLYEGNILGIVIGIGLLIAAFYLAYEKERYSK